MINYLVFILLKKYSIILFFIFSFNLFSLDEEIPATSGRAGKIGFNFEFSNYIMTYNTTDSEKWYYIDESFHLLYNSNYNISFKLGILYFYTERLSYSFFIAPLFEIKKELDYHPTHIAMGVQVSFFILKPLSLDLSISTRYDSYNFLLSNGITYYFLNFESNQLGISDTINILIKQNLIIENYISLKWNILF